MRRNTIFVSALISFHLLFCQFSFAQVSRDVAVKAAKEVDVSLLDEAREKVERTKPEFKKKKVEEEKTFEGSSVLIKTIDYHGIESLTMSDLKPIEDKYLNRKVYIAELEELTLNIEKLYLEHGIIAAAYIPAQKLAGGVIRINIVEAKFGKVATKKHRYFDNDRPDLYLRMKEGDTLFYEKISRSLQRVNRNPDREVKSYLQKGDKPEQTDIVMDIKSYFPVHLNMSYDREGGVYTGKERKTIGVRHNNFLQVDDIFMAGYSYGKSFSSTYLYHNIPVTNTGTSITYGYSDSRSVPKKEFATFGIGSRSQTVSLFANQDLYYKTDYLGEINIGIDSTDKVTTTHQNGTISRNRFRTLEVKGNFIDRGHKDYISIQPHVTQGLNIFGARRREDIPPGFTTAISGYKNTFTKGNLGVKYVRLLQGDMKFVLNFHSQLASEELASQERFSLGGMNSIRGYPSQDFLSENGARANFELIFPAFFIPERYKLPFESKTLKQSINGLVFLDEGYGQRRGEVTLGEDRNVHFAGVGAGVRVNLYNQFNVKADWGIPIGTADKSEAGERRPRFHILLEFADNFEREFLSMTKVSEQEMIEKIAWRILEKEMKRADSSLRGHLLQYRVMAKDAEVEGNTIQAQGYYENIRAKINKAYFQTKIHVAEMIKKHKTLKDDLETAHVEYQNNNYEKAMELWGGVAKDAELGQFSLNI